MDKLQKPIAHVRPMTDNWSLAIPLKGGIEEDDEGANSMRGRNTAISSFSRLPTPGRTSYGGGNPYTP